jgi:hypothetical protein
MADLLRLKLQKVSGTEMILSRRIVPTPERRQLSRSLGVPGAAAARLSGSTKGRNLKRPISSARLLARFLRALLEELHNAAAHVLDLLTGQILLTGVA